MTVLHVNTHVKGGAANACLGLHRSLIEEGVDSHLLTLYSGGQQIPQHTVFPRQEPTWYQKIQGKLTKTSKAKKDQRLRDFFDAVNPTADFFSFIDTPYDITRLAVYQQADIINLHWVGDFLDWPSFFRADNAKKLVWTLHDLHPFTGGYHYAHHYRGYEHDDQGYPPAASTGFPNLAQEVLKRKKQLLKHLVSPLHIVSPSRWLRDVSTSSALFRSYPHHTIPYSIDSTVFKPMDQATCRQILGLPSEGTIALFVSQDVSKPRKGFKMLLDSIQQLPNEKAITLCSVGGTRHETVASNQHHTFLHEIKDARLMAVSYNAADAFIIPSIEDNLPNTMLESVMCGTPVVGFAVGGIKDVIQDGINGYLSKEISAHGLASAIEKFIDNKATFATKIIRKDAEARYAPPRQARTYIELYKTLLSK